MRPIPVGVVVLFASMLLLAPGAQAHHGKRCHTKTCEQRVKTKQQRAMVAPYADRLARIRRCESRGNYRAVDRSGSYRGAYQFDHQTWRSVGGRGDPAHAGRLEQDFRAAVLYKRRGAGPWPVCGYR